MQCACVVGECGAYAPGGYKFSCLAAVCIVFELEFIEMDEMAHNAHARQYLSLHCYCRSIFMQRFLESGVVDVAAARHRIKIVPVEPQRPSAIACSHCVMIVRKVGAAFA